MAQPISSYPTPRQTAISVTEVRNASAEHADAVLSAFELLQLLHDRGVLNLIRGLLGAGDEITAIAANAVNTEDSIRAIRNFMLLSKFFASIHPDVLSSLVENVRGVAERQKPAEAPGIVALLWRMRSEDSRHAAAVALDLLEAVGKGL